MGLATFAFNTSTYFKYNGKLYKWLDGTALASQVSVVFVVAGTLVQNYFPCSTRHSAAWNKGLYCVFTLRFSRSPSPAQKTDAHQQTNTRSIRLSTARLHSVHKITTSCNSITTHILLILPKGA